MAAFRRDLFSVLAFALVLLAAPLALTNDYYVSVLILCCLNAMVAVGLNLLLGYAGQISLGHAAFYGLAAYASGILSATCGLPIWLAALVAVTFVGLVAWLLGIPTFKLSGHYLAMATLGFGLIVSIVMNEAVELTGGPSGMVGIPRFSLPGLSFAADLSYYRLLVIVLAAIVGISLNLIHSRIGRALRAVHGSERAAEAMGIDIGRTKRFVFVLSALFAAVAGVLYAHYLEFVAPSSFGFLYSVELIVMVVLGGLASVWGAVAGAFFLTVLPEFLRAFEDIEVLLFGAILVAGMMFLPSGLAGGARRLLGLLQPKRGRA
jgi:branched-chain amino acid transport system permease protein